MQTLIDIKWMGEKQATNNFEENGKKFKKKRSSSEINYRFSAVDVHAHDIDKYAKQQ